MMSEHPKTNRDDTVARPQPTRDGGESVPDETLNLASTFDQWFDQFQLDQPDELSQECSRLVDRLRRLDYVARLAGDRAEDPKDAEADLPRKFGQLELLERLGRGGMGEVFKARHAKLGRIQVVKVLHRKRLGDPQAVARFFQEMRAVGQLNHPNIVAAHHADQSDGIPYLVMDYVEGESVDQLIERHRQTDEPVPIATACDLIRQAAIGLAYAHENGIVHRDIKPGNLMVDRSGTVKILDLGLARMTERDDSDDLSPELTAEHQVLGTVNYMAPEQVQDARGVDARADVYALGATLFRLLTGRPVFPMASGASLVQHLMRVLHDPVPDIRTLRPDVPDALAALIKRCLEKDPNERLASAAELAEALQAWSDDAPRESSASDRPRFSETPAKADASRSRIPPGGARLLAIGGGFFALILLAVMVIRLALPGGGQLLIECDDPQARIAIEAVQDDQTSQFTVTQGQGTVTLRRGPWRVRIAGLEADQYRLSADRVEIASGKTVVLRVTRVNPRESAAAHAPANDGATAARKMTKKSTPDASSRDGRREVAPSKPTIGSGPRPGDDELRRRLATIDWNAGSTVVNDVEAGILRNRGLDPGPGQAAWIPGYASFPVTIPGQPFHWQILPRFPHVSDGSGRMSVSPRGTYIADSHHGTNDPYVRILERKTGRLVGIVSFHSYGRGFDRQIAWAPDERRLLVCTWTPVVWRCTVVSTDGRKLAEWSLGEDFRRRERFSFSPHWSPDGKRILLMGRQVLQQRTPEGALVETFVAPKFDQPIAAELWSSASSPHGPWSPSGDRFAVATGSELRIYPADGGEPVAVLKDEEGSRFGAPCFWHPGGKKIFTNRKGADGKPVGRLWTLDGAFIDFALSKTHESAHGFSPDGRFLVTNYGEIRDPTGRVVSALDVSQAGYVNYLTLHVRWLEPGRLILFFSNSGSGHSVEYSPSGRKLVEYRHAVPISQSAMTWLPQQERFMSIGVNPNWHSRIPSWQLTWDAAGENDSANPLRVEDDYRKVMSFSRDGTRIAIPVHSGTRVLVYDMKGQRQYEFDTDYETVLTSWSPDGTLLATAGYEAFPHRGTIAVWRGREKIATFKGHAHEILGLVWDPTGSRLLSWDGDLNVFVWDVENPGKPISRHAGYGFKQVPGNIHWGLDGTCPRWSPSGKRLAVPTEQGVVIVSPTGEQETTIAIPKKDLRVIWWTPDEKHLIVGKTIYDLSGKKTGRFGRLEDDWSVPFLYWLNGGRLVAGWHRGILFCDRVDGSVTDALSLPGFNTGEPAAVTLLSRGVNSVRVSPSGRYLLHSSALRPTHPNSHYGDVHLIDLKDRRHVWTGLAFDDGTQIRIEPTGRVRLGGKLFDDYLTYVIGYDKGRLLPLTELQFAARIGLAPDQQFVQRILDYGGRLTVAGRSEPLTAADLRDARDLPPIDSVLGIDLAGNSYVQDDDLGELARMSALEELDLSGTAVTIAGLTPLHRLTSLRRLKLAGLEIDSKLGTCLPAGIEELDVHGTDVTDFLVYDLRGFRSLKRLDVRGTAVSAEAVSKLREALPDCTVRIEASPDGSP